MLIAIAVTAVICLPIGFGVGRIKNSKKLEAIKAELGSGASWVSSEARDLATKIRAHL